jgi:uncharacterized membrane protein YebE (DUF533 family)
MLGKLAQSAGVSSQGASTPTRSIGDALGSGVGGGLIGGAISGGLISAVLGSKKGRKVGGKVLAYGGTALVAGLAYKAWRDYRNNRPPADHSQDADITQVPADSGFAPDQERDANQMDFRLSLIRAMIAAAKSDGHIDQTEHARISEQITALQLGNEEKAFLFDAFSADADPIEIAKLAKTEEQSAELYLVSNLVIDPDDPAEMQYIERLSDGLRLSRDLRQHLDFQVQNARHHSTG